MLPSHDWKKRKKIKFNEIKITLSQVTNKMPVRTPTEAARPASMWWRAGSALTPQGRKLRSKQCGCSGLGTGEGRNCLTWLWHCDVLSCSAELEVKGEELLRKILRFRIAICLSEHRFPGRSVRVTAEDSWAARQHGPLWLLWAQWS